MKKKFLAIYALVGALVASPVLTSCIDSEESPTVTAIRNANAEKQKAMAALATAQAEAEAVLAKAQAALLEAQAQAELAAAKKTEAETALLETQNEQAKITLEIQKKNAERQLAEIQAQIERLELETEAALLRAQRDLLIAQDDLQDYIDSQEEEKANELRTLTYAYTNTLNNLLNAKRDLSALNVGLIKAQAGLANAKTDLEKTILENNNQIALNNVQIEAYKATSNYTEDIETLKAEEATLRIQKDDASKKFDVARNKYKDAEPDMKTAEIIKAAKAILTDEFYRIASNHYWGGYWDDELQEWISFEVDVNNYITNATQFNSMVLPTSSDEDIKKDELWIYGADPIGDEDGYIETKYTHKDIYKETIGHKLAFAYETGDLTQFESYVADLNANDEANVKTWEADLKTAQTNLATAQTAEATAKKAWEEAAEADKATKKADYDAAIQDRINAEADVENSTNNIEDTKERIATRNNTLAIIKKGDAELQEKIAAYNEAVEAECAEQVAAWPEMIDAKIAYNEIQAKYNALKNLLYGWPNGANDIADRIKALEEDNAKRSKAIEEAKLLLDTNWVVGEGANNITREALIEWYEGKITAKEAEIATLEIEVEAAKAELDAAMPEEEEAE